VGGGRCLAVVACMHYCVGWNDAVSGREHSAENPNQSKNVSQPYTFETLIDISTLIRISKIERNL
jgi:hypothetical protein